MTEIQLRAFYGYLISAEARAPLTAKTYLNTLRVFQEQLGAERLIENAGEQDCVQFMLMRSEQGITGRTLAKDQAALRSFYRFLQLENLRSDNPAEQLEMPRLEKKFTAGTCSGRSKYPLIGYSIRHTERHPRPCPL